MGILHSPFRLRPIQIDTRVQGTRVPHSVHNLRKQEYQWAFCIQFKLCPIQIDTRVQGTRVPHTVLELPELEYEVKFFKLKNTQMPYQLVTME